MSLYVVAPRYGFIYINIRTTLSVWTQTIYRIDVQGG